MKKNEEVIPGYVPQGTYTLLLHKVEKKDSAAGLPMVVIDAEIVAPETAEHAGETYKTLGAKGKYYVMLAYNDGGEDAALSRAKKPLQALGLYDSLPEDYSGNDVYEVLKSIELKRIRATVDTRTEYFTDSTAKGAAYDIKLAKRDPDTDEPMVKRHLPNFDFGQVKGLVNAEAEQF